MTSCSSCKKTEEYLEGQTRICAETYSNTHSNVLGYINDNSQSSFHANKLKSAFVVSKLWKPGSEVKIGFLSDGKNKDGDIIPMRTPYERFDDPDPLTKEISQMDPIDAVKKIVLERYQPITNLKFTFVDDPKNADVRIDFVPDDGAWSVLGTDCLNEKYPNATMNFGWYDAPTILHEFGHCLALIHEHQNPRGKDIPWDKPKLYKWAKETQGWDKKTTDINIIDHYELDLTNGSDYDPLSIMLYFFPGRLTLNNKGTKQNTKLSGLDVKWITNMYGKGEISAEEFYPKIYGISLEEAINKSKEEQKLVENFKLPFLNMKNKNNIPLIIFLLLISVIIFYLYN